MWLVFKCQIGSREFFMAWAKPHDDPDLPGFEDIAYTEMNGVTPHSPSGGEIPSLGDYLFTVPDRGVLLSSLEEGEEEPSAAERFRAATLAAAEPEPGPERTSGDDDGDE